jgi:ATP-dependent DNA helicase RecG
VSLAPLVPDPLPEDIQTEYNFLPKPQALEEIHFPASPESGAEAVRRLKFDELLAWQVFWQGENRYRQDQRAEGWPFQEMAVRSFVQSLPFTLTTDQRVAAWQILQDIARPEPMSRLLQGDVGSGKTVVAALVAYNIMTQGGQVAFLTPTILLAEQHFKTFNTMLGSQDLTIAFISGERVTVTRQGQEISVADVPAAIQSGDIQCVIGTHALIQNRIGFARLGLVMVDEQQRFGVEQRDALLKQNRLQPDLVPHFLSLTATPIPRTLALFLAGELSITTLKNRPSGHGQVTTEVVGAGQRASIDRQIKATVEAGHQAFVVTPLIEESDALGVRSAVSEFDRLQRALPGVKFGLVHGSLPAEERLATLEDLRQGRIDVVVGTTVLEVGIDIQNATLIVIEGAERFGLAQLHQLRGRVGRGLVPGQCILATDSAEPSAKLRLQKVANITDGFKLAELDLSERGGGELYGLKQSGLPDWQLASLSDTDLLLLARQVVIDEKLDQRAKELLAESLQNVPGVRHRE